MFKLFMAIIEIVKNISGPIGKEWEQRIKDRKLKSLQKKAERNRKAARLFKEYCEAEEGDAKTEAFNRYLDFMRDPDI